MLIELTHDEISVLKRALDYAAGQYSDGGLGGLSKKMRKVLKEIEKQTTDIPMDEEYY